MIPSFITNYFERIFRYAYHLRKWALEGKGISNHSASLGDRSCTPIRLIVQPGSSTERCFLDMLHSDYVADLRAEIVKWCEGIQQVSSSINLWPNLYYSVKLFYR